MDLFDNSGGIDKKYFQKVRNVSFKPKNRPYFNPKALLIGHIAWPDP